MHLLQQYYLIDCMKCRMLNECNDGQRLHQHMQPGPGEVWYRECAMLL